MNAWALTRDEFEFELIRTGERRRYGKGPYGLTVAHHEEVRAALGRGSPVPAHVLTSYPDLEEAMKARLKLRKKEAAPEPEAVPEPVPAPEPARKPAAAFDFSGVDLHAYGKRWHQGAGINTLAREVGCSWNRLWSELAKLGYRKGAA